MAYFFDPLQLVGGLLVGVAFGGVGGLWFDSCNPFALVGWLGWSCHWFEVGKGGYCVATY